MTTAQAEQLLIDVGVRAVNEHAGMEFVLSDGRRLTLWTDDEHGHEWELRDGQVERPR